jgi:hypothetical protein
MIRVLSFNQFSDRLMVIACCTACPNERVREFILRARLLHYPLNLRHRDPRQGEAMANLASDPAAVAYRRVSSSEKVIHLQRKSVRGSNVPHQSKITARRGSFILRCDISSRASYAA